MWSGVPVCLMPMSKFSKLLFSVAIVAALGWWYQSTQPSALAGPFVAFLDVGQGDAIYIRTTAGADILVDGGPDRSVLEELPNVLAPGDTTIELMMLSHPDADHINGLIEVAQRYQVKQLVTTGLPATKSGHQELMRLVAEHQIEHLIVTAGDQVQISDHEYFKILYPNRSEQLINLETNDTSFIAEYHFVTPEDDSTVLFTGDAGEYVEEVLVAQHLLSDIDLLKVGHHGSLTSSSDAFLAAVQPETCVIQVGEGNSYGHPKPEILQRLQPYCQIQRTDQLGTIVIPLPL